MTNQIKITLRKGRVSTTPLQRLNLRGLGLRRRHAFVIRPDTSSVRGMIQKVLHLVDVDRPGVTQDSREERPQYTFHPGDSATPPPETKTKKAKRTSSAKAGSSARAKATSEAKKEES